MSGAGLRCTPGLYGVFEPGIVEFSHSGLQLVGDDGHAVATLVKVCKEVAYTFV